MNEELVYRRLVKPSDLNSGNRLFGGQMLSWIDENACTYVLCQLDRTRVVTSKVSEVNFIHPAKQADMLEFYASTIGKSRTTLTVRMRVMVKKVTIVDCSLVFVAIDENGKPEAHGK
jgi:acyl-CoA thioesterase YciA